MSVKERDIVLTGVEDGYETIDLPITRLGNVEDDDNVETIDTPADDDALPIIDASGNREMKKIIWTNIINALNDKFPQKAATLAGYGITDAVPSRWVDGRFEIFNGAEWVDATFEKQPDFVTIAVIPSQNGSLTYDGSSKSPVWNDFSSAELEITGDVSGIDSGEYTALFTPNAGYMWLDGTNTAKEVTWSISKAVIHTVPAQNGSLIYNGSAQTPSWGGYDSSKLTLGGATSGIDAGSYSATFTPTNNYTWSDGSILAKTVSWSIDRATIVNIPSQSGTIIYDGTSKSPSWSNYDSNKMTLGGTTSGANAGSYDATFTPKDNYQWYDGSTTPKTASWTITARTKISTVPSQSGTITYDGNSKTPLWSNYDSSKMTLGGTTSGTNAGSYNATFTPKTGYEWSDGTIVSKTVSWTIDRLAISTVPSQSGTITYDGSSKAPQWINYDSSKLTLGGTTSGTNAGSYDAAFTPKDNYQWDGGSTTAKTVAWSIGRLAISTVPSQSGTIIYDGSSKSPSWSNYDSSNLTLGGTASGTNAGSYNVTFTPKNNYQWSDSTTSAKTVSWSVGKASGSLSLSADFITLDTLNLTKTISVIRSGSGTVSAVSSDTNIAAVSVSGTTVTVSHVNKTAGLVTITVKVAADTNYNAADSICFVTSDFYYTFGVCIDTENSNPETALTYTDSAAGMTGGSSAWNNQSIFKDIKPCMLLNGVVQYYLNPNDFTKKADGTAADITSGKDGDVMIEFPKIYYSITDAGRYQYIKITNKINPANGPNEDWHAYAHTRDIEGDREKLYLGAYFGIVDSNGQFRSLSGKTIVNPTSSAVGSAQKDRVTGYDPMGWYQWNLLRCLYIIRYKNLDSISALGKSPSRENPVTPCGNTDKSGMYSGTPDASKSVKFAGIEDIYGNHSYLLYGCHYGGYDIRASFKNFNDSSINNRPLIGPLKPDGSNPGGSGYFKKIVGVTAMGFAPTELGGSATTYYCAGGPLFPNRAIAVNSVVDNIFSICYDHGGGINLSRLMFL